MYIIIGCDDLAYYSETVEAVIAEYENMTGEQVTQDDFDNGVLRLYGFAEPLEVSIKKVVTTTTKAVVKKSPKVINKV